MAYSNRYTSSGLYSANAPRQVGHQQQGEPGPSQQPKQQQPQGDRTNAGFLGGLDARMTPPHSGSKSKEKARLALAKQHRTKKYEQIEKREKQRREKKQRKNKELQEKKAKARQTLKKEQWNREKREREDKEFQEKKAKARQTTEENERRRKEGEVKDLINNADEHARVNEAFLRRLEAGMTHTQK